MIDRLAGMRWLRGFFFVAIGLAVGWAASALWPYEYTSRASVHVTPPSVSPDLLPGPRLDASRVMDELVPVVFSNSAITTFVSDRDLYPSRLDQTAEELGGEFRRSLHVEQEGADVIRISFTYGQAVMAQTVTRWLVSALIDRSIRDQSNSMYQSVTFFEDQAHEAGKELVKAEAKLHATPASDPQYPLASLDRDLKRKACELIGQKLAEAKQLSDLHGRKQGQNLELLDPATFPLDPDTSPWFPRFTGLMAGLATWLLIECRPGRRVGVPMVAESEVVEDRL